MTAVTTRTRHPEAPPAGSTTGTMLLARLDLRSSRWFWLVWVVALATLLPITISAYRTIVPEGPSGAALAEALAANPAMRAMLGHPYELLIPGGFAMWRVGTFTAAAAALMATLGVIRATRAEEEAGRIELLRSGVIGRHAPLAGALVVAFGACAVLGLVIVLSLAASTPFPGALAAGAGIALTGAVWAGVGAVAAQVSTSARTCRTIAVGSLGVAYLMRAVADASPSDAGLSWMAWLSPAAWAGLSRPYAQERWWVLALPAVTTVVLVVVAFALEGRRDLGAGLRAARPGPAHAAASLRSVPGLVSRLERGAVVGWAVVLPPFGLVMGSLVRTVETMFTDTPQPAQLFHRLGTGQGELRDAFLVTMIEIVSVLVAIFALQLMARLRAEEDSGRAELVLSTGTTRVRYALAHVVPALVAPTLVFVLTGAAVALPDAVLTGEPRQLATFAGAAALLAPGLWVFVGLAMLVAGWAPRLSWLPWVLVAWTLFTTWVGGLFDLPEEALKATPFAPLPHLPVDELTWAPVIAMTSLAVALLLLGLWGYHRRDIGRG